MALVVAEHVAQEAWLLHPAVADCVVATLTTANEGRENVGAMVTALTRSNSAWESREIFTSTMTEPACLGCVVVREFAQPVSAFGDLFGFES